VTDKDVVDMLQRHFSKQPDSSSKIAALMLIFGKRFWEVLDHFRTRPE
jgi:hypothetical protein